MFDWKNILIELARKITTPLAFAVLLVVALGQFGASIPAEYTRLVYAVGLGSLLIWSALELARVLRRSGRSRLGHARNGRLAQRTELNEPVWLPVFDVQDSQPEDLYTFVPIPAGQPQAVELLLAKYPVTNRQYARFLKPENFANQDLWLDLPGFAPDGHLLVGRRSARAGWAWISAQKFRFEDDMLLPDLWREAHYGLSQPDAPVVGVSWYEASAYCKWLLWHWDELDEGRQGLSVPGLIRLPAEVDSAQASGLAWLYPWGESLLMFSDMPGTVWEWQANFKDKNRDYVALRGVSWSGDMHAVRVVARGYDSPFDRHFSIGFRVLVLSAGADFAV
jgi:hypothetical protein